MTPTFLKRTQKAGLPPGTLVHIGEKRVSKTAVHLFWFNENDFEEKEISDINECINYKNKDGVTWINVEGFSDVEVTEKIGSVFNIHSLALEDILNTEQRPKFENFESFISIILKMLLFQEGEKKIFTEHVGIVFGNNFVISFQEGIEGDLFNPIRERIRSKKGKTRRNGADYLAYSLIDVIVDNYFIILEKIGEKIDFLEKQSIKRSSKKILQEIYLFKKEVLLLRKSAWPIRELVSQLGKEDTVLIKNDTKLYLRDVYDHTIQVIETIETFREILSSLVEIYLTSSSNKLNEIMRTLTIISTVFTPPVLVAGIYGMNFEHMPEIGWQYGYPMALAMMVLASVGMYFYFRKKGWL